MVHAFSFCLYGPPNPLYYPLPMLENIYLAGTYFPMWKVYIYVAPDVDSGFVTQVGHYSNVVIRQTEVCGPENMIHRFFAIDEPDVETMFSRDADSRIHWKDRWAINDFMSRPAYSLHGIRDNKSHGAVLLGGLWGMRKIGINMRGTYEMFKANPQDNGCGYDQSFLAACIYPHLKDKLLVHYSNGQKLSGEHVIEFPFEWTNDIFCGRPESNFKDTTQPPAKEKSRSHVLQFLHSRSNG